MGSRTELQTFLEDIPGVSAAYFQPPASISLSYPCIVYDLTDIIPAHADNRPYILTTEYTLTVIDKNPDTQIIYEIGKIEGARFSRFFASEGLNHYVFTINF